MRGDATPEQVKSLFKYLESKKNEIATFANSVNICIPSKNQLTNPMKMVQEVARLREGGSSCKDALIKVGVTRKQYQYWKNK